MSQTFFVAIIFLESVTAKEWAGISSGFVGIFLVAVGITAAFICGVVYEKVRSLCPAGNTNSSLSYSW